MVLALLSALVVSLLAGQPAPTADWPQFRNTPNLSGVATSTLPAALKVLWTYDAGGAIESSAAVVDGVVYVGAGTGELLAIDLATGKLKWKYRATSADFGVGESSPAVAGGLVYVGDLTGVLRALVLLGDDVGVREEKTHDASSGTSSKRSTSTSP